MDERDPTTGVIPLPQPPPPHTGIYLNLGQRERRMDYLSFSTVLLLQCKLGEDLNMAEDTQSSGGVGSFYFGVRRRVKIFFN